MSAVQGTPPQAAVEVTDVSRWYGNVVAVNGISFALGRELRGCWGQTGPARRRC